MRFLAFHDSRRLSLPSSTLPNVPAQCPLTPGHTSRLFAQRVPAGIAAHRLARDSSVSSALRPLNPQPQ